MLLGLNINVLQTQHLDAIRAMRPTVNLLLDPKGESSSAVKAAYPDALLIGRPYIPDSEVHSWYLEGDPTSAGKRAAEICLQHRLSNPAVDAWILINEPPVATVEQIARLAIFDSAFAIAMKNSGSRGCIGGFARGTPEIPPEDRGAAVNAYIPALRVAEDIGALVAIHQYGFANLLADAEWHVLRWQKHILPWLQEFKFEYAITETGIDLGTGRMIEGRVADGWKDALGDTPEGRERYANQLLELMKEYAKDHRCVGATVFCAGNQNRWGSFDVTGPMLDRLMAMPWPARAKPPAPVVVKPPPAPVPTPPSPTPTPPKPIVEVPAMIPAPIKPAHIWAPSPNFTPNRGVPKDPAIVWHHTGGALSPSLSWLRNPASGVSTQYLIAKTGALYQLVRDTDIAWHAGYSLMPDGRENVNAFSFGVELENAGNGKDPYPPAQIDTAVALGRYLAAAYGVKRDRNVTHELIRRLWKERYPNRRDDQGRPIDYKNDPRGLDVVKLLDRIYAVELRYDKVVWAIEEAARILQREGMGSEHDFIVKVLLSPVVKLRDA